MAHACDELGISDINNIWQHVVGAVYTDAMLVVKTVVAMANIADCFITHTHGAFVTCVVAYMVLRCVCDVCLSRNFGRILGRTWVCDDYLHEVEQVFISGSQSLTQKVQHSLVIAGIFEKTCLTVENGLQTKIKHLSASKHRFESLAKPGGRSVLFVDGFIGLADELLLREDTDDRAVAESYLEFLSSESYLQNAMMADAADESLMLTRYLDSEQYDLEELSFEVGRFLNHVLFFFAQSGSLTVKGYTEFALSSLRRVRVLRMRRGGIKTFGGVHEPSQEVKVRCLQRMSTWTKLAMEVVKTELTNWEIFQAFSVLSLSAEGRKRIEIVDDEYMVSVRRLAKKFGLDPSKLQAELEDYRPLALHIYTTKNVTAGSAWSEAVRRRAANPTALRGHPQSALRSVVQRLAVYAPSTSGVEQSFTRVKWMMGENRGGAISEVSEVVGIKLLLDRRAEEEKRVIDMARENYVLMYGVARSDIAERSDVNCKRKATDVMTEKKWLEARRDEVDKKAKLEESSSPSGGVPQEGCGTMWTASHEGEAIFQRKKRSDIKGEAYQHNALLEEDVDSDLERESKIKEGNDAKNDLARKAKLAKTASVLMPVLPTFEDMKTWHVHIEKDCLSADLKRVFDDNGIAITEKREKADLFVAVDPTDPGQRTKWWAVVKGAFVVAPSVLLSQNGPAIKYHAAKSTARRIWISPKARAKHTSLVDVIEFVVEKLVSKWKTITGSEAEFTEIYKKSAKAHRGCSVVGIVGKKDNKDWIVSDVCMHREHITACTVLSSAATCSLRSLVSKWCVCEFSNRKVMQTSMASLVKSSSRVGAVEQPHV
jgi:hypothetical protein